MDYHRDSSFAFVLVEWIGVDLLLSLWELQGSILNFFMKFSSKAPTIYESGSILDFSFPLRSLPLKLPRA